MRLARTGAVLVALAEAVALVAAAEDGTCVNKDGAGGCLREPRKQGASPEEIPKADLITQEISELEDYIKLAEHKISLLNGLKGVLSADKNLPIPSTHVRALKEDMPIVSRVVVDEEKTPTNSADDFLISKRVIRQPVASSMVDFLPLRNPRSSSPSSTVQISQPSALLVVADPAGDVRLYTPQGELVREFVAGHDAPLERLSVSPSHDEYFVATADVEGSIRVHIVKVRPMRLSKEEKQSRRATVDGKISQYLGLQSNVTIQLQHSMQVPPDDAGDQPKLTSFVAASQKGSKYFAAGDADGRISVFTRNGTFVSKIETLSSGGVEGLHAQASNVVYRAGGEWGFVNLEKLEVTRVDCPSMEGHTVSDAVIDSQQAARALVSDEEGTVYVFNVKNRSDCKLEHQFPRAALRPPVSLASVRGFTLGLERPDGVVALNMSRVGKGPSVKQQRPTSNIVWRKRRDPVQAWVVHKRFQQGDLLAFLAEDGLSVEVMELLMTAYTEPAGDPFGNMKLPVIAVAVVLVLGYQLMKQKNKSGSGKKFDMDKYDFSKHRRTPARGMAGGLGKGLRRR